jgi:hypothetical protein
MKSYQCYSLTIVLLALAGCSPSKPAPSGEVYQGKHVSEWGDAVVGSDAEARLNAAKVLANLGKEGVTGHQAIQNLHVACSDEDPLVRGWSAVALVYAVRGTPFPIGQVATPVLKEATQSSDEELRATASQMLERMQAPPAGPPRLPGMKKEGGDGPPAEKKQTSDQDKDKATQPPGKKQEGGDSPPAEKTKPAPAEGKDKTEGP